MPRLCAKNGQHIHTVECILTINNMHHYGLREDVPNGITPEEVTKLRDKLVKRFEVLMMGALLYGSIAAPLSQKDFEAECERRRNMTPLEMFDEAQRTHDSQQRGQD